MNSSVKLPIFQNQASSEGSGVIISVQQKVDGHHEIYTAGQVLNKKWSNKNSTYSCGPHCISTHQSGGCDSWHQHQHITPMINNFPIFFNCLCDAGTARHLQTEKQ